MHYYKRNIGDYAKKAGRLSMLQHGSYTLLIDACYDRERFPNMEEAIEWTWASSAAEIEAVQFVLRKFFTLEGDVYVQDRVREELEEYAVKSETNKRIAIERETNRKERNTNREPLVNEPPPNHKPITNNHKPKPKVKSTVPASAETTEVFEYWKLVMKHPGAQLDAKRSRAISGRLKDGYTVSQLCKAVDGCKASPHHQGDNATRTIYDDIELICRDGPKVDGFANRANAAPANGRTSSQQQTFDNLQKYLDKHQ